MAVSTKELSYMYPDTIGRLCNWGLSREKEIESIFEEMRTEVTNTLEKGFISEEEQHKILFNYKMRFWFIFDALRNSEYLILTSSQLGSAVQDYFDYITVNKYIDNKFPTEGPWKKPYMGEE